MMKMNCPKAKELTVAYIGGGSRGWAWGFMTDLALDGDICGTVRLYDIDRPAAERNRKIGGIISAEPEAVSRWIYTVSDSLEEALSGADFVVISILKLHQLGAVFGVDLRNSNGQRNGVRPTAGEENAEGRGYNGGNDRHQEKDHDKHRGDTASRKGSDQGGNSL